MCAVARQLRVISVSVEDFTALMRGELRVRNFPADGQIIAATPAENGKRVGCLVLSAQYASVPAGQQLPLVTAVIEHRAEPLT